MKILIIADTDLDGTGAATIITEYHNLFLKKKRWPFSRPEPRDEVEAYFPSRSELNEKFEDEGWVKSLFEEYDIIYLCDTGLNTNKGNENLGKILAPKVIYFDHHATNLERQSSYIVNYKEFWVEEGDRCTAKIAFDVLNEKAAAEVDNITLSWYADFSTLSTFAMLVNDLDMWYREYERSTELADYVASVGPVTAYKTFLESCYYPFDNTPEMDKALEEVGDQKERSLKLAKATLVKHKGYKVPFHTCLVDDWASWVAGEICPKSGLLAMFDIANKTLSFRVGSKYSGQAWHEAKGRKPNCLDFAEPLGGGGHPQAAGVSTNEALKIFKSLSHKLGEVLLEDYHG